MGRAFSPWFFLFGYWGGAPGWYGFGALPLSLATQQAIVAEIEAEQALVAANRELITRFGQKIQATLARIWGGETSTHSHAQKPS